MGAGRRVEAGRAVILFFCAGIAGGANAAGQRVRAHQIAERPIDDDAGGGAPIEPGGGQFGGARALQSVEPVRGH